MHFKGLINGFQIFGRQDYSISFSMIFSCFKNAILLHVYYMGYVMIWNTLYIRKSSYPHSILHCSNCFVSHMINHKHVNVFQQSLKIQSRWYIKKDYLGNICLTMCKVSDCISYERILKKQRLIDSDDWFLTLFLHLDRLVIHEQGEAYDKSGCITSTLNVAKGNRKPLDLYLAETKAEDGVQQNVGFLHICK